MLLILSGLTNWSRLNESCYLSSVGYYYSSQNGSQATSLGDVWGNRFKTPILKFSSFSYISTAYLYTMGSTPKTKINSTPLPLRVCSDHELSSWAGCRYNTSSNEGQHKVTWKTTDISFKINLTFRIVREVACSYSASIRRRKITSIKGLQFAGSRETDHFTNTL